MFYTLFLAGHAGTVTLVGPRCGAATASHSILL
jgi:hypothetical protein